MQLQHDNFWEKIRPDRLNTLFSVTRKEKGNYRNKGKTMKPSSLVNSGNIFFNICPHYLSPGSFFLFCFFLYLDNGENISSSIIITES